MARSTVILLILIVALCQANVLDPTRFSRSTIIGIFGIKIGYEFGKGFFLSPEINCEYLYVTKQTTNLFGGIAAGYRKVFSREGNESNVYADMNCGAITVPVIIYGISIGPNLCMQYGSRPVLFGGRFRKLHGYKKSIFGGFFFTTTDITWTLRKNDQIIDKSVAVGQKFAVPFPPSQLFYAWGF
jgi:hypothetical protein